MDSRPEACPQCGVPVVAAGRFCSNCGAPLAPVSLRQAGSSTPPGPVAPDADPYESLYAAPVPAPAREPLLAPAPVAPPLAEPPVSTAPGRPSPGPGLWIGAAVLLVGVLVLGTFLLVHGVGGSPSASSTPPIVPKPSPTSPATSSAPSTPASSATSPSSAATPSAPATEVAGQALASAPRNAPPAVDFAGNPVTYVAANMVDGRSDTCWRAAGDATGMVLTFRLAQPTTLTRVGLINGYDKIAYAGGHRYDWYAGNRRVLSVDWVFDDGTTVPQQLGFSRRMQSVAIKPVKTSTVQVRILSVSPPGHGPAARDDTAVSEVSLRGATG